MAVPHEPDTYLEARIRDALATDDRTNYLDPQIAIAANKVFLMGPVESEQRREVIETVVREVTPPDIQIVNELCVEHFDAPVTAEEKI
jgi:hypothetical protein